MEKLRPFSFFLETAPDAIIITSLSGKILRVNDYAKRLFGYANGELSGCDIEILVPVQHRQEHVKYRDRYNLNPSGRDMGARKNLMALRKNGELFPIEVSLVPMSLDDEQVIISYLRDITNRRSIELALQESENKYRSLFLSNPLPMWIYEIDTLKFLEVNNAAIHHYGYPREEFLQMTLLDIRKQEDHLKLLENVISSEDEYQQSKYWKHTKKDGTVIDVEIWSHFVSSGSGKGSRLVVVNDVTEQLQAKKMLEEARETAEAANELKTLFINNISHEIRTPINGILGLGEILVSPDLGVEEKTEFLEMVKTSTSRLIDTINSYMDISMILSHTVEKHPSTFEIKTVLGEQKEKFIQGCSEKGLELVLIIPSMCDHCLLDTDRDLFGRIFSHLLSNAVKFTSAGRIIFGFNVREMDYEFFVTDTGIGIGSEAIQRIFHYFEQEYSSRDRKYEGSGLGLAIVRGFVKILGGETRIESIQGEGTTVTFTLPHWRS